MTVGPRSSISPGSPAGTSAPWSVRRSSKPGAGPADGRGHGLGVVLGGGGAGRARLGEPVARDDEGERQLGVDPPDELDRDVRRPGDRHPESGQVVVVPTGVVEDRLVDRRRTGQDGDLLLRHAGEDGVDVEHGLRQHRRPAGDAGQDPRLQPEHVEVGVDHQVPVVGAEPGHGHPVGGDAEGPAVGHDHALGDTGRARGEEDVRPVVGTEVGRAVGDRRPGLVGGPGEEVVPADGVARRRAAGHDDGLQVGQLGAGRLDHGEVVGVEEVRHRHQHASPAALEDDRGLGPLEPGVHGDEDGSGLEEAEDGDDPLPGVGRPNGHPVTALDP